MYSRIIKFYHFYIPDKPLPPAGPLDITDISEDRVTLTWRSPISDGGSKLTGYIVEKCEARKMRWVRVTKTIAGTETCRVDHLLEGADYYFRVMAENQIGVSVPLESDKAIKPKSPYGKRTNMICFIDVAIMNI